MKYNVTMELNSSVSATIKAGLLQLTKFYRFISINCTWTKLTIN